MEITNDVDIPCCFRVKEIMMGLAPDQDNVKAMLSGKHDLKLPYFENGHIKWTRVPPPKPYDPELAHMQLEIDFTPLTKEYKDLKRGHPVGRIGTYKGQPAVIGEDTSHPIIELKVATAQQCKPPDFNIGVVGYYTEYQTRYNIHTETEVHNVARIDFEPSNKILKNPTRERILKYLAL